MSFCCCGKGDFLFIRNNWLILDQTARKRARRYNCGEQHSFCSICASRKGMVSPELAGHLGNPEFTLPAPLTLEQAKQWTPTLAGFSDDEQSACNCQ